MTGENTISQVIEAQTSQILNTNDAGALIIPAEILGHPGPFTRFVVEQVGSKIVIAPEPVEGEWLRQWRELSEEIGKVRPEGVSPIAVVSEMRR